MNNDQKLSVGEWVEVRSKEEILATLDKNGLLEGLPFMPEMFAFCGQKFRVYKRAHKTCDTITGKWKGRKMKDGVHLDGIRCNGGDHGGCEAGCLIFWKQAWLRKIPETQPGTAANSTDNHERRRANGLTGRCSEKDVLRAALARGPTDGCDPVYACQTTLLLAATEPLSEWDVKQYMEDYASGNVGLGQIVNGFIYMGFRWLTSRIRGRRLWIWLYDKGVGLFGNEFPRKRGLIPLGTQTPGASLNLQPGELVRVKSYEEILATCDTRNKNRGLSFDAEMVPYCGKTYRVLKRVTRILDEKTGKMVRMKSPSIILDGVVCQSKYSECRLFCPRSIYSYWREIWLERVNERNGHGLNISEATLTEKSEPLLKA